MSKSDHIENIACQLGDIIFTGRYDLRGPKGWIDIAKLVDFLADRSMKSYKNRFFISEWSFL